MSLGGAICSAMRFVHPFQIHRRSSVLAILAVITRVHCIDFASITQCCSNALFFCFQKRHALLTLPKGKPLTEREQEQSSLGHVMVSLCLMLCIIGALSTTLVSGLSLSKGTFHPELTATERGKVPY